jgi:MoxR-like ATPase
MPQNANVIANEISRALAVLNKVKDEISKVIVGQTELIQSLITGLLADGHLLLEGVPGIAKTLAANTLARTVNADFKRVQFTPDLLPADLIGTPVYNLKENSFEVKKGPIFTNILLADEINRAPAKVQSALLEVMQEKQVTISGQTFPALNPFLVLATQNPIEQEGTYPLAEAQTDRFMMKIKLTYPTVKEEKLILERMGSAEKAPRANPVIEIQELFKLRQLADMIYLDDKVVDYLLSIVHATREPHLYQIPIEGLLEYGASPRATLALKQASKARALLAGRYFVTPQDIKDLVHPILRHRLRLSYEAEAENLTTDDIIDRIIEKLPIP